MGHTTMTIRAPTRDIARCVKTLYGFNSYDELLLEALMQMDPDEQHFGPEKSPVSRARTIADEHEIPEKMREDTEFELDGDDVQRVATT